MDVTHSLLVAIMFVGVLSMGIGSILSALPKLLDRRLQLELHWIPVSWLFLLLLEHFNLFWHTIDLLAIEEWSFGAFLYVIAGPILLFAATSLMIPDPASAGSVEYRSHYFDGARPFFSILAALMVWEVGVDLVLGTGLTVAVAWNAAALALFLALAASPRPGLHAPGTGVAWALFLSLLALRALGWGG